MPKTAQFEKSRGSDAEDDDSDQGEPTIMPKKKAVLMDAPSLGRMSFTELIDNELQRAIDARDAVKIYEIIDGEEIDVTPKPITAAFDTDGYKRLKDKAKQIPSPSSEMDHFRMGASSMLRARSSRGVSVRLSMEDIIQGVGSERMLVEDLASPTKKMSLLDESSSSSLLTAEEYEVKQRYPFIRVVLRKTELKLLYEQRSMTAIKHTEDGNFAEYDNKQYDYLTIGRGKIRRRSDGEAQTEVSLSTSRKINTLRTITASRGTYVSYFEMYDTYKNLEKLRHSAEEHQAQIIAQALIRRMTPEQQALGIVRLPAFHWVSTVMKRLLFANNSEMSLRRYRNMNPVDRTISKLDYKYSLVNLFTIHPYRGRERRAVSDMSYCCSNNDILAVGYGIYSYQAAKMPSTGEVCIWSIKNTNDPERFYNYNHPVVSVAFSPYMPTLLAIGLFDGTVEVRDIANFNEPAIAVSQRSTSPGVEPVLAIKWIKAPDASDSNELDPFIALSQDGTVTRYRIINSPFLLGNTQMVLERIEGVPEGLQVKQKIVDMPASNPHPQGLNLTKHPVLSDIYYILTDEGCIHKCSTNYQQHYLEVLKTHSGAVSAMDFSPWSPKLYLTSGNDWRIRIWIVGVLKPLITLQNGYGPYQWSAWSRTHSTMLMALTQTQFEIWDLRRSILKPVSTHVLATSFNTLATFSRDGTSIAIGNESGRVFINTFDDKPFEPHYQYDTLERTIYSAVASYSDLMNELKSCGYFGYPRKAFVMPP